MPFPQSKSLDYDVVPEFRGVALLIVNSGKNAPHSIRDVFGLLGGHGRNVGASIVMWCIHHFHDDE